MIKTRITEMLNIAYPIVQGGMQWLSTAELAAAVSQAGGLGLISAATFPEPEDLRSEIRKARELTGKPFGVNISMLPQINYGDLTEKYFQVVLEEEVPVVETAGRSPEEYVHRLKETGIKLIHKVPAVRYAQKAEKIGADAVTVVGFECGGHPGMDDVTTLVLAPRTASSLSIPVLAGGGIADGRGFVAALSLGAEGIVMGTRFATTTECLAHTRYKEWIASARETDTMIVERSLKNPLRAMRNLAAEKVLEMEQKGATLEELMPVISGKQGKKALEEGNLDEGVLAVGQVAGLIEEIKMVQEVIEDRIKEASEILEKLKGAGL